jgi:hypothetical protein
MGRIQGFRPMTIIRTMLCATPARPDLEAETASVRAAMDRADAALDRGMPIRITSNWNTASPLGRLTIQYDGSDTFDLPLPLVLAFDVEGEDSTAAGRWMESDGREALAVARACLDVPAPGRPHADPDEADLVATGLAWSLIDEHGAIAATMERATPWSRARIVLGTDGGLVRTSTGGTRPSMTWREHDEPLPAAASAIAAMRPGTLVRPKDATARMEPIRIRLSPRLADPVARMRALAAWAAFRDRSR